MVGGVNTDGLTVEHIIAINEVNEWEYRKALGLSYEEYLKEPVIKKVWGLTIEGSIKRFMNTQNGN